MMPKAIGVVRRIFKMKTFRFVVVYLFREPIFPIEIVRIFPYRRNAECRSQNLEVPAIYSRQMAV